jgi:hypothetical protein
MKERIDIKIWLPAILIWISLFLILAANTNHVFQRFAIDNGILFGLFNIAAIISGIVLLVQSIRLRLNIIPLLVYIAGFMACWAFGVH